MLVKLGIQSVCTFSTWQNSIGLFFPRFMHYFFFPLNLKSIYTIYIKYIFLIFLAFILLPRLVVLNLLWASESPGRPHSQIQRSLTTKAQGPRICISNKSPGDADVAGVRTTFENHMFSPRLSNPLPLFPQIFLF